MELKLPFDVATGALAPLVDVSIEFILVKDE
jgi:hypothetical protein